MNNECDHAHFHDDGYRVCPSCGEGLGLVEILRDDKHVVLVEPTMKERMDEAAEWHKKHFPHDLTED